ncbi:MAG: pyruvate dehydrogenase (acetyl-transferring) E1 component subunit alpha [Planctomycetes bacterium]|nr:pyruvate dehydrogenase (acetyl-transferring) E1 component subunit alpha [Planctomycetota bacterium]
MCKADVNLDERIDFLRQMLRIRTFEEKVKALFNEKLIRGAIHLYSGEEAVAVGVCAALRKNDWIVSTHRGHGHCIAKGGDIRLMFAELLGRSSGCCGGKGGSMHIAQISRGILGASAIVGSGIPIAIGAALTAKTLKMDRIAVSFFGDGASNNGAFHESLNIASLWKLPVVFVCENNLYGITVPVEKSTAIKNIADRAAGYSMPGEVVDGNDAVAVAGAARRAVRRARMGNGPALLECKTYRYEGHWVGDPIVYRTEEEQRNWRQRRDCIDKLRDSLMRETLLNDSSCEAMLAEVEAEINSAAEWARTQPTPATVQAFEHVYSSSGVVS